MQDLALYPQELLLIYPIIRYYAETELSKEPALAREIASLVALCRELDMVQSCKFGAPMNVAEQQQAASQHLEKFCDAYGEEAVKPKHHYANHIPRNDIRTLDCFLHERENKNVRAIASSIQNTDIYEASVLVRVTAEKCADWKTRMSSRSTPCWAPDSRPASALWPAIVGLAASISR